MKTQVGLIHHVDDSITIECEGRHIDGIGPDTIKKTTEWSTEKSGTIIDREYAHGFTRLLTNPSEKNPPDAYIRLDFDAEEASQLLPPVSRWIGSETKFMLNLAKAIGTSIHNKPWDSISWEEQDEAREHALAARRVMLHGPMRSLAQAALDLVVGFQIRCQGTAIRVGDIKQGLQYYDAETAQAIGIILAHAEALDCQGLGLLTSYESDRI